MTRNRTHTPILSAAVVVVAVGVLVGTIGQSATPAGATRGPDETETAVTGSMTIVNDTDNQQPVEIVEWAVGRYELADLALPSSEIHFHAVDPSLEKCYGHGGYHQVIEGENGFEHLIDMCTVGVNSRRRLILHEFAHAWAQHNLSQEDRQAFIFDRGLEGWNDGNDAWVDRATEHVAEIMAWGLDERCTPREMLAGEDHASLVAAFESLTGTEPLCQTR